MGLKLLDENENQKLYSFKNVNNDLWFGVEDKKIEYLIGEKTVNVNANNRPWTIDKFKNLKKENEIILLGVGDIVYYDFFAADSGKRRRNCEDWIEFYENYWFARELCYFAKKNGWPWISNPAHLAAKNSKQRLEEISKECGFN